MLISAPCACLQILIESGSRATEFEDITVDAGWPLLADMLTDSGAEHVYTISPTKVHTLILCATSELDK